MIGFGVQGKVCEFTGDKVAVVSGGLLHHQKASGAVMVKGSVRHRKIEGGPG